jgi:4-cresol dehydrogenase (hydroxylating)
MEGAALEQMAQLTCAIAEEHGVFIMTGAEAATMRSLIGYVSLAWDRDEAGADGRAMAAHDDLMQAFNAAGFHSYRLALPSIAASAPPHADWAAVVGRLRHALDPQGVLGSGRVAGL